MLPVGYVCSSKSSFRVSRISLRSHNCCKDEVILTFLNCEDITGCKTSVSGSCLCIFYLLSSFFSVVVDIATGFAKDGALSQLLYADDLYLPDE